MRLGVAAWAGILWILSAPLSSAGQESSAERKEAGRLMDEGNELFARRLFDQALERYRAAYAHFPSPKILLNFAAVFEARGEYASAAQSLERFLHEAESVPVELRSKVVESLGRVSKSCGKLLLLADGPVDVLLDGQLMAPAELQGRWLLRGTHHVLVRKPGYLPFEALVEIKPLLVTELAPTFREILGVDGEMSPPEGVAASAQAKLGTTPPSSLPSALTAAPPAPPAGDGESSGLPWIFWAVLGGAVVAGASASAAIVVSSRSPAPYAAPTELGVLQVPTLLEGR